MSCPVDKTPLTNNICPTCHREYFPIDEHQHQTKPDRERAMLI